jgi:hypothetical protein
MALVLALPTICLAGEATPQAEPQDPAVESSPPRQGAGVGDPSVPPPPNNYTPLDTNPGGGSAVPINSIDAIRNSIILDAPLDAAFGTMLSLGVQAGIRLTVFDDWEISPRAGFRWRQVKYKRVNQDGGAHLENASTERWLPDAELLVGIPILVMPTMAKGNAMSMWGTVFVATVPTRRRLTLVSGVKVAFANEGRQDWAVPAGLRYGASSCARVHSFVQTVEFLKGWWVQARALVLTRERRVGVDAEVRRGDFFLYTEYFPRSDAQAEPAGACPAPPCALTKYPYSSFHGAPGASQTLVGLGVVFSPGWGL